MKEQGSMMHSSEFKVLIVEDDEPKLSAIRGFFKENYEGCSIVEARSLTSAIGALDFGSFDLAVVDMSLPTYDINEATMGGGAPQGFGGEDVIRFVAATCPGMKMLVVTQYDAFPSGEGGGVRTLDEIGSSLRDEVGSDFMGVIYYSGQHGDWRVDLSELVDRGGW